MDLLVAYLNVLFQLLPLNVSPQLRLVDDDVGFKTSHFLHDVLVHRILMNSSQFFSEKDHLFLDESEYTDLFIFIEEAVSVSVEHFNEITDGLDSKEVVNGLFGLLEDQLDVGFVKSAFISEVSLSNSFPDSFTFLGSSNLQG